MSFHMHCENCISPHLYSFGVLKFDFDVFVSYLTQIDPTFLDCFFVEYESAKECIDTNYYGAKATTKALLPHFRHSPYGGRIINVGSNFGKLNVRPSR